jgi:PAS domain S-box-containing protein
VSVEWDADGRVTRWPAEAEALFGWRAEEVLGKRSADWPFVHPDDRAAVRERTLEMARGTARQTLSINRNVTRDGRVLHCEWYNTAVVNAAGELTAQLSLVLDVTARERAFHQMEAARAAAERAAERTRGLQWVTAALSEALTPAEVTRVVVEQGMALLGAAAGVVVLLHADGELLELVEHRGYPEQLMEGWRSFPATARVPLADAARTGEPVVLRSLVERARLYPALADTPTAYPAILSVPLSVEGEVLGALGLSFAAERALGEEEIALGMALAGQCAQAVRRATLYEREREARREVESLGERLHLALDSADIGTWDFDPVSGELSWDKRCRAIFGVERRGRVDYRTFLTSVHPDDRAATDADVQRALDPVGAGEYTVEYRIRGGEGAVRWALARGRAFFEGEGDARRATRFVGTVLDVTERVRARRRTELLADAGTALAVSSDAEGVLRELARIAATRLAAACAVFLASPDGAPEQVEAAVREDGEVRFLGRPAPSLLPAGHPVARVLLTGRAERLAGDRLLAGLFGAGEWGRGAVVPMRVDGRTIGAVVLASGAEEGWGAEEMEMAEELARRAALAVERARLYERALAANVAKSQFLATMSHEIRTPINAIIGFAELLEIGIAGPLTAGQAGYLERVRYSTRHLLGLINDILDLAKVEAGEMRFGRERVPAEEAAASVVAMIVPQAEAKGVRLASEVCQAGAEVLGDGDRIRQVLLNLVSNAVKFTHAGGRVTVRSGISAVPPPARRSRAPAHGASWRWRTRGSASRRAAGPHLRPVHAGGRHAHAAAGRHRAGAGRSRAPLRGAWGARCPCGAARARAPSSPSGSPPPRCPRWRRPPPPPRRARCRGWPAWGACWRSGWRRCSPPGRSASAATPGFRTRAAWSGYSWRTTRPPSWWRWRAPSWLSTPARASRRCCATARASCARWLGCTAPSARASASPCRRCAPSTACSSRRPSASCAATFPP